MPAPASPGDGRAGRAHERPFRPVLGRDLPPARRSTVRPVRGGGGRRIVSNQNRVMAVAPGSTDVASACAGAAYNTGIAAGALLGGAIVPSLGVHATALVGGVLAACGCAVAH